MYQPQFKYAVSSADKVLRSHYKNGLTHALRQFNVDHVVLSHAEIKPSEDTYIILAHAKSEIALGGIRLEIKSSSNKLPIESCCTSHQVNIQRKIDSLFRSGKMIAEVSGLWVNAAVKGLGLGPKLVLEATTLGLDLGLDALVCLPPQHTYDYFKRLSYSADPDIPPMAYPDDRYISTVAWLYRAQPANIKYALNYFDLNN